MPLFQSAVRIAVSLKSKSRRLNNSKAVVSIRRADRCLAEVGRGATEATSRGTFQSAVRIAVSLKPHARPPEPPNRSVSIRRADRCLAEGCRSREQTRRGHVSIRRADRCLAEGRPQRPVILRDVVSIRRADRCLAEGGKRGIQERGDLLFQSAVRIAVSLKRLVLDEARHLGRFNPPCGSLSR